MPKRTVDAHFRDGTVRSYRIDLRPSRTPLTDDECLGIAKQYHVEDGLLPEVVDLWVVRAFSERSSRKT